jgi:hypothetical protein
VPRTIDGRFFLLWGEGGMRFLLPWSHVTRVLLSRIASIIDLRVIDGSRQPSPGLHLLFICRGAFPFLNVNRLRGLQ